MSLAERLAQARGAGVPTTRTPATQSSGASVPLPPPVSDPGPSTRVGRAAHRAIPTPVLPPRPGGSPASAARPALSATSGRIPAAGKHPGQPATAPTPPSDALGKLKDRTSKALYERIGARMTDSALSEDQLHSLVRTELGEVVDSQDAPLTPAERERLLTELGDDVLGHGPLQRLLDDDSITEIMVNGVDRIYVERGGRLERTTVSFASEVQLRRVIERIVSRVGRRIDESSPLVDARLPDGSRVNAVIPPLAVSGSTLTIRKFARDPFQVSDLIAFGTLTPEMAELLDACVAARLTIIVSGGTGTGKTTLLNVLSSYIPTDERIVTIEDSVELQLQQDHVVRLEARPPNVEGRGEITIRDLVRNALRMRPDRIVVGECRGGESLDMLQAMNTGHDGSLSTVHANSPRDAIARLETLVLMAGMELPLRAVREQIASAVDVVIQLTRLRDGTRRVTHVTEVQGMEGDVVTLQDAFVFDYSAGVDASGRFLGRPVPTGVRPRFADKFRDMGIKISPSVFGGPLPKNYRP